MRKFILMMVVAIVTFSAIYITSCTNQDANKKTTDVVDDSTRQVLDRGKYLFNNVAGCVDCHSLRDFSTLLAMGFTVRRYA